MTSCRRCGVELVARRGDLCETCRQRALQRMRWDARQTHQRSPDLEPPHSRPWVNRKGG